MAFKNNTREDVHSGLTQSKSDQKWSDMLNFRSSSNRTMVVSFRRKLFELAGNFHTIIKGVNDIFYVIGSNSSWLLRGYDNHTPQKLWRLILTRNNISLEDQSEEIKIRGSYTGTKPTRILVTLVNGKLIPDFAWPVTIEPEPEVVPVISLNCGDKRNLYQLLLTVLADDAPVVGAEIEIFQGVNLIGTYQTNANGLFSTGLSRNFYSLVITHPGYAVWNTDFEIVNENVVIVAELVNKFVGLTVSVRYSNTLGPNPGGHTCDSAIYKLLANGVEIGVANLNNAIDGGDRQVDIVITSEMVEDIVAASTVPDRLQLSLVCYPEHPDFDLENFSGGCHANIAWVVVTNANNVELYNNMPVGNFLTLNL